MAGHPTAGKTGGYASDHRGKKSRYDRVCAVCGGIIRKGELYEMHYGCPIHPGAYFRYGEKCDRKDNDARLRTPAKP